MEVLCRKEQGLFPAPSELSFDCSCPDSASMCKHVSAALYGVGARLDRQPELLFLLRHADQLELVSAAGAPVAAPASGKLLPTSDLSKLFGIELAEAAPLSPPRARGAAKPPAAPARKATIRAKELVEMGVPRTTFQNWVTQGVLGRTPTAGTYRYGREAKQRVKEFLARKR